MEKECLEFLLRGEQLVIVVLGKGLNPPRLAQPWRTAIDASRLLVLSPFDASVVRTTRSTAKSRNEFIVAHAVAVLIPHASPGGQAEAAARKVPERGKTLFTFDDEESTNLHHLGARPLDLCALMRDLVERETL